MYLTSPNTESQQDVYGLVSGPALLQRSDVVRKLPAFQDEHSNHQATCPVIRLHGAAPSTRARLVEQVWPVDGGLEGFASSQAQDVAQVCPHALSGRRRQRQDRHIRESLLQDAQLLVVWPAWHAVCNGTA